MRRNVRVLAFYLPQFHPIAENDRWWGPGFTDWRSVVSGLPRFKGHHQPQLPADLGFYDLRLEETRLAQADMARAFGIHGFCYYHYWFSGTRLLEAPFERVLRSGKPDFPFCLCWANESWTRAWDGLESQVLIRQEYSRDDNVEHIAWLLRAFSDRRYIRIDNRPLLLIYRIDSIPDSRALVDLWQQEARSHGLEGIYLCAVKGGFLEMPERAILDLGFDAVVDFQPNRHDFPSPRSLSGLAYKLARERLPHRLYQRLKVAVTANKIIDYDALVSKQVAEDWPKTYRKLPCVFPSWDNSARRRSATIIQNSHPQTYGLWLRSSIEKVQDYPPSERLVFINAWNEWAEGCHLEPDSRNGRDFLRATQDALRSYQATGAP